MKIVKKQVEKMIEEELKTVLSEKATQIVLEGGMPSSVIARKQKIAYMSDKEFADMYGHKSEEELRQMAWRHGYGKMSDHYVKRLLKAANEQLDNSQPAQESKKRKITEGQLVKIISEGVKKVLSEGSARIRVK